MPSRRSRFHCTLAIALTIAAGLASRRFPGWVPGFLGKYPGDALWAMVVFFSWGWLLVRASTGRVALLAFGTACAVEVLKLSQLPWLVSARHTTLGYLVLGHVFSWHNLVAYAVGVALACLIESLIRH